MGLNISEGTNELTKRKEEFTEQLSAGEQIEKDGLETDRIAASIDTSGLDSSTIETTRQVTSDLSSAFTEKISEVQKQVEKTSDVVKENVSALGETQEQVDENARKYSEMAGVSEIGKAAADAGRSKMESDSQEYRNLIQENETQMEKAEEDVENMSSSIKSLFKR